MASSEVITPEMAQIKAMIIESFRQRESLKNAMKAWYEERPNAHFPMTQNLILVDATLSKLDTHYKTLWDRFNAHE
ncbi:MAG: hypothetical protein KU37_06725 [Sulfuricurvum sp. PC08-66]|nr:MAG: hypothetical protein KU37_06725 [Sulfuricurvum sp. PC08-66]